MSERMAVNYEIVDLMKRRIDELSAEEFFIVRDYVERKAQSRCSSGRYVHSTIGGQMVRRMIEEAERQCGYGEIPKR